MHVQLQSLDMAVGIVRILLCQQCRCFDEPLAPSPAIADPLAALTGSCTLFLSSHLQCCCSFLARAPRAQHAAAEYDSLPSAVAPP